MGDNWNNYNAPAIWAMLQGENVCTGADRVLAWENLATSVRDQHKRLMDAGRSLAEVWPPEQNASAAGFLRQMEGLATSMQDTLKCAEDTRAGLNGLMSAVGEAQMKVRSIAANYESASTDWIPKFIDSAEDEYDEEAQQAMRAADKAIADHSTQIKAPELFQMPVWQDGSTTIPESQTNGSNVQASPVPVSVPHEPVLAESSGASGAGVSGTAVTQPATTTPDPSLGIGPGLTGVGPAPAPPTNPGLLPTNPITPGPTGLSPELIGTAPLGLAPPITSTFGVPPARAGGPTGRLAMPTGRALPSGAVIGQSGLGGGSGRVGQAPLGAGGQGRAGGAQGKGVGLGGQAQGGRAGQTPLGAQGNRRGKRADGTDATINGEADELWETEEGVTPVIAPDTTVARHDPGPGIIGFGR